MTAILGREVLAAQAARCQALWGTTNTRGDAYEAGAGAYGHAGHAATIVA